MTRSDARRHAFILVFGASFDPDFDPDAAINAYFDALSEEAGAPPDDDSREFIRREVTGALARAEKTDKLVDRHASGWSVERVSRVDLAILRLALYEMLYARDIPEGVAINEAVELAKEYGQDDSPAFINGILGSVSKAVKARRLDRLEKAKKAGRRVRSDKSGA